MCLARQRLKTLALDVVLAGAAVFRSADAFGARCVITTGHAAFLRSAMHSRVHWHGVQQAPCESGGLRRRPGVSAGAAGKPLVGTSAHGDALLTEVDLTGPVAMVIGNETFGMSKAWREKCDVVAKISHLRRSVFPERRQRGHGLLL